jgi:hypothetical protein
VCNRWKADTFVPALPILPPVDGFGDYDTIMASRTAFLETVSAARLAENRTLVESVKALRAAGKKGYIIRAQLTKKVGAGTADRIMRETR